MNKIVTFAMLALLSGVSQASYLYWQVNTEDASDITFEKARVVAIQGETSQILSFADDEGVTKAGFSAVNAGQDAVINLDQLSNASAYSFYIELVNYNASTKSYDVVGFSKSNAQTYAQLVSSKFIDDGSMGLPVTPASVWHGGTFAAPEPTSAMLVMMGLGVLALKRRKV